MKLSKPASLLITGITGWVLEAGAAQLLHLLLQYLRRRETLIRRKGKIKAVTKRNAPLYLDTKSGTQGKVQVCRA